MADLCDIFPDNPECQEEPVPEEVEPEKNIKWLISVIFSQTTPSARKSLCLRKWSQKKKEKREKRKEKEKKNGKLQRKPTTLELQRLQLPTGPWSRIILAWPCSTHSCLTSHTGVLPQVALLGLS